MEFCGEVAQVSGSEDTSRARTYKVAIVSEAMVFTVLYASV
jgi:hypothetical protein